MGIDVIRLGGDQTQVEPRMGVDQLAQPSFQYYNLPNPSLSIWLMSMPTQQSVFPWWRYESKIDEDIHALSESWAVSNPQSLFDCLFLTHLQKSVGANWFVVFPGNIKTQGWGSLREMDRESFKRGQSCVYHLHAAFQDRLTVNWVPFWEPQSIVRNPGFGSLWRLFSSSPGDEVTRCVTFFSLSNPRFLPDVVKLFIENSDHRSEKLAALTDWFGVYSSPLSANHAACAVFYSQSKEVMKRLEILKGEFMATLKEAQREMVSDTRPRNAIRILSRLIAL